MRGHVGQVELIGLPDTPLVFPLQAMYPSGTLGGAAFEDLLDAEHYDPRTGLTTMPVTSWLLRAPDAVILVDTGSGDLPAPGMEELHPGWPASTDRVQPLLDAGVADLVDGVHRVTSGITMRRAAGHTPGQMRVDVRSGDDLAILCADVVHFPFEITHPEIASHVSDHDPALAALSAGTARRLRRRAPCW